MRWPGGSRVGGGIGSAWWAVVAASLIAYASLYPLTGWDHPAGWAAWREIRLPWPRRWTTFDVVANVLGYLPLGALLWAARVRSGANGPWGAALVSVALCTLLSAGLEALQNLLPGRVPSSLDLACNAAGAVLGCALAALVQAAGWADAWQRWLEAWIRRESAAASTLLLLWPLALLYPTPLPLALGQVFDQLAVWSAEWMSGSVFEPGWRAALGLEAVSDAPEAVAAAATGGGLTASEVRPPLSPRTEAVAIAFALLAPCMVAFTVARPGWRRVGLALGAAGLAWGALTLSAALNFSPQHALSWQTPQALAGIVLGMVAAIGLSWAPTRLCVGLGLLAIGAMLALVAQAPADPYFAESLASWEQGRFIRFHGASQWIGWIWPFAAAVYLLREAVAAPADRLPRMPP